MPFKEALFYVDFVRELQTWYTLAGRRRGPFSSASDAHFDLMRVVRAWNDRAKPMGGWVWLDQRGPALVVVLPEEVDVEGVAHPDPSG